MHGAGAAEEGDRSSTHLSGDRGSPHMLGDRGSLHMLAPDCASGGSLGYGRSVKGPRSSEDMRRRSVDVSRRSTETSRRSTETTRRSLDDAAMYAEEHPNACVLFAGEAAMGGNGIRKGEREGG